MKGSFIYRKPKCHPVHRLVIVGLVLSNGEQTILLSNFTAEGPLRKYPDECEGELAHEEHAAFGDQFDQSHFDL